MPEENESRYWIDELPNDPTVLKELIRCQVETLGIQSMELHLLHEQRRDLRRKNQILRDLIWPCN